MTFFSATNPCDGIPCAVGATCVKDKRNIHGYTCVCPCGMTGDICDIGESYT